MSAPTLTYRPGTSGVCVDVDRLIASRMLIQANSGGGKSRALRQLLEQTHGRVQHLVLDPEGEFATLRERFDYVLFGKEGDYPATPKTARIVCRRLVELGASAVLDLYDLSLPERREFVRLFLVELMNLPRALWRPILVVIDEAHLFAPQSGESQSTESVIALCTQGRKRGFCAVLATQRISKLHKDAAAELLNKLIGRTGLDVDVKRAGDELGLNTETRRDLRTLKPGEFYAYGPAIANEIQVVRTGDVLTTHPEAGSLATSPPPAPAKVRAVLAQLADLPQQAAEEARTMSDLQAQLRDAQAKLRKAERGGSSGVVEKPVADERAIARAVAVATRRGDEQRAALSREFARVTRAVAKHADDLTAAVEALRGVAQRAEAALLTDPVPVSPVDAAPVQTVRRAAPLPVVRDRAAGDASLGKGERVVLTAVAQHEDGVDREQLSVLTGYKRSSRDTYLQRLQANGLVELTSAGIRATESGRDALGADFEPLPTGDALRSYWLGRLSGGERAVLEVVINAYPEVVGRDEISEQTEYKRSSRDTYLQRLAARKLVTNASRAAVRASDTLFNRVAR